MSCKRRIPLFLALFLACSGCQLDPFEVLGSTEHGVKFSALPPLLGGGVEERVYGPKQKVLMMPWERLYRMDTSLQSLSWGEAGEGDNKDVQDFVHTRAIDGNEVALAMTVTYRVVPEKLSYVIQHVGVSTEDIRRLVTTLARADIRTQMNFLRTEDFATAERQKKVEEVKGRMNAQLLPEGIEIVEVIYEKGLFYRQRADGTTDSSYQDQMNETEQTHQRTEQERNRLKTVEEEMKQKFTVAEGEFFRVREQADGQLRQAEQRAVAKFDALKRDADRVQAVGLSEIEGMKREIAALSGPGGRAIVRREIAKGLEQNDPRMIVLSESNHGGSGSIDVNRLDTNEIIRQLGLAEGTQAADRPGAAPAADAPQAAQRPPGSPLP